MKPPVDNQLPEALARFFAERGIECRHVHRLGLGAAPDAEIRRQPLLETFEQVLDDPRQQLASGAAVVEID